LCRRGGYVIYYCIMRYCYVYYATVAFTATWQIEQSGLMLIKYNSMHDIRCGIGRESYFVRYRCVLIAVARRGNLAPFARDDDDDGGGGGGGGNGVYHFVVVVYIIIIIIIVSLGYPSEINRHPTFGDSGPPETFERPSSTVNCNKNK